MSGSFSATGVPKLTVTWLKSDRREKIRDLSWKAKFGSKEIRFEGEIPGQPGRYPISQIS
jgi:hypothetical protein